MPRETEKAVHAILTGICGPEVCTPAWLKRPGLLECRSLCPSVQDIYRVLASCRLPDTMPPRERRTVDGVFHLRSGQSFIFELDEKQHFNGFRATTLRMYPDTMRLRFSKDRWIERCLHKKKLEGGGFATPKPPLFPGENGRHRQRVFRDALSNLLPQEHGFAPTLRLADTEIRDWIFSPDAADRMTVLISDKLGETWCPSLSIAGPAGDGQGCSHVRLTFRHNAPRPASTRGERKPADERSARRRPELPH